VIAPNSLNAFIAAHTELIAPPLVPEVRLHLAADPRGIFDAAHAAMSDELSARPYWAFAWPGGQALARHLIDNPHLVANKRILDLGAGSALCAIAAMMGGARSATAVDIDPLSAAAGQLNAAANGVALTVTTDDLLGREVDTDIILIGDLVYEPDLKDRVGLFLAAHVKRRIPIFYADRTSARRPPGNFRLLAEHDAPLLPAMVEGFMERARVWQL
jgi:predicted nicotinamide N-methyase